MAEIDLDPNFRYRQAAQNTFFTGMQLGGQIADRRAAMALRQQQMDMNQRELNARLAQMDIQNKDMELQRKARDMQLAEAVEEKTAQVADFRLFNDFMRGLDNWAMNPTGNQMPERPQITSKVFNAAIDGKMNQYREMLPAYQEAQANKELIETKRRFMVDEKNEDLRRIRESGIDYTIPDNNEPLGYRRDPVKYEQAMKTLGRNQMMRSVSGAAELSMLDPKDIADATGRDPQVIQKVLEQTGGARIAFNKEPAAIQYADRLKKTLEESGIELTQAEYDEAVLRGMAGTNALNVGAKELGMLKSENKAIKLIDNNIAKIEEFNAKYGPNAFATFVGPIDSMVVEQFASRFPADKRQAAILDAKNIFSNMSRVIQEYRLQNFGTALTLTEVQRFLQIIRDPNSADYERSLKNFRNGALESIQSQLGSVKVMANVPTEIKQLFRAKPVETYKGEFEAKERAELEELRRRKAASQPTQ